MSSSFTTEEGVLEQFRTIKSQLEFLLDRYPFTRDSDTWLILYWLKIFHKWPISFMPPQRVKETNIESVPRIRRVIQRVDGRFPPTDPEVIARRDKRERAIRKAVHEI